MGLSPKPLLLGGKYVITNLGVTAWFVFNEMMGLSGFLVFVMVFSNVPSAEQGGEYIGKTNRF